MKTLKFLLMALPIAVLLQTCADDESDYGKPEKVQFNLSVTADPNGRIASLPPGLSIVLSITKQNGDVVLDHEHLSILNVAGTQMTEPIELAAGNYKVTDFLLVNDDMEVLYATPRIGSTLSGAVETPLPYNFRVTKNNVSNVHMQVIDVQTSEPEAFGYASFHADIVRPLQISVFTEQNGQMVRTSATAYIINGWDWETSDTLQVIHLGAKANVVPYKIEPDRPVSMMITKDGYESYRRTLFTYDELMAELAGEPLTVILNPFLEMTVTVTEIGDEGLYPLYLYVQVLIGENGSFFIDFGDDYPSESLVIPYYSGSLRHDYDDPGTYTIRMYGDLNRIAEIHVNNGNLDDIDLTRLPSLETFQIGLNPGPANLDFSTNKKLLDLTLSNGNVTNLTLPQAKTLQFIWIDGCANLNNTAKIDAIINTLYTNTVMFNKQTGSFHLNKDSTPAGRLEYLGPPSPAAMDKLRIMQNQYDWYITPRVH